MSLFKTKFDSINCISERSKNHLYWLVFNRISYGTETTINLFLSEIQFDLNNIGIQTQTRLLLSLES